MWGWSTGQVGSSPHVLDAACMAGPGLSTASSTWGQSVSPVQTGSMDSIAACSMWVLLSRPSNATDQVTAHSGPA